MDIFDDLRRQAGYKDWLKFTGQMADPSHFEFSTVDQVLHNSALKLDSGARQRVIEYLEHAIGSPFTDFELHEHLHRVGAFVPRDPFGARKFMRLCIEVLRDPKNPDPIG